MSAESSMRPATGLEAAIREQLTQILDSPVTPDQLDADADLADVYGLTSLNKVVFMMSACDATGVSLAAFDEPDIATMRTLRDVTLALGRARRAET